MGKSYLCLELALGVANGGQVLGREVEAQKVLYIALEDTEASLCERLKKMGKGDPQKRIDFTCIWRRDGDELSELRRYLKNHPDTRLVIIDTLARFCSWKIGSNYNIDYEELSQYKALADSYGIALVLVHHERKNGAKDRFDRVSGSTGLTGAADTLITLERSRSQDEATLFITGRDHEDAQLALRFNRPTCTWEVREKTEEEDNLTPERQEVVDLLKAASGPLGLQDIAMALGKKKANMANLLKKLVDRGLVAKVRYGKYQLKSRPDHDQGGSSFRSAPSLTPEIAPCESHPASPIPGSEAAGEDSDLHSAYPVNESMNQEKIKAGLLTGLRKPGSEK